MTEMDDQRWVSVPDHEKMSGGKHACLCSEMVEQVMCVNDDDDEDNGGNMPEERWTYCSMASAVA